MNEKLARIGFAALLALTPATVACDREDKKDLEEVGEDVDKEVDQLDSDGKDD